MRESELSDVFPYWEKLKKTQRELLMKDSRHLTVEKGHRIVVCGNSSYGCFYVRRGSVLAFLFSETETETELFRIRKENFFVVDYEYVCGKELPEVAYTAATATDLIAVGRDTFRYLMKTAPFFAERIANGILTVFPGLITAIGQRDYDSLDKRISTTILSESVRQRSNVLSLTHNQIASKIGSAREAVTRKLKEFCEDGTLQCSRGKIVILNREQLKKRQRQ